MSKKQNKPNSKNRDKIIMFTTEDAENAFRCISNKEPYLQVYVSRGKLHFKPVPCLNALITMLTPFGPKPGNRMKEATKAFTKKKADIIMWCRKLEDIWNSENRDLSEKGIPTIYLEYKES